MKSKSIVVLGLIALTTAGLFAYRSLRPTIRDDLNRWCELATQHEHDGDPVMRAKNISQGLAEQLRTREVSELFKALAGVDPAAKPELMKRGAADLGETWACPSWDRIMATQIPSNAN